MISAMIGAICTRIWTQPAASDASLSLSLCKPGGAERAVLAFALDWLRCPQ